MHGVEASGKAQGGEERTSRGDGLAQSILKRGGRINAAETSCSSRSPGGKVGGAGSNETVRCYIGVLRKS